MLRRSFSFSAVVGIALAASVALAQAPAGLQSRGAVTPRPSSRFAGPNYNYYATPSWMYPSYTYPYVPGGPNPSFQVQKYPAPSAEQPYPLGYEGRSFAPPPFLNDTAEVPLQNITPEQRTPQGILYVFVPVADAVVYLNGQRVPGSGTERRVITPLLPLGSQYQYAVTITFDKEGQMQTEYRRAVLGAGEYTVADFTRPAPIVHTARLPSGPLNPNWMRETTTPYRTPWTPPWSPQY